MEDPPIIERNENPEALAEYVATHEEILAEEPIEEEEE
jgi:hypothetical protein